VTALHAPPRTLRAAGRELEMGARPLLMGIVNASPDSFSDGGENATPAARLALAEQLVEAGADIIDVGGESATTGRPPVPAEQEIERVAPLVERIAAGTGAIVSVDTYKPETARAAVAAGASIVNDVSGLRDPGVAEVCAATGAALVVMHTLAAPRERLQDPGLYGEDITAEVLDFLRRRMELAMSLGVGREQLIVDPGPDFAKTPAQTVTLMREVGRMHELGRPVLLAISRKDFIGALTGRRPRERLGGTLAALSHGLDHGCHIFRVHDVAAAADFVAVRAALKSSAPLDEQLALDEGLRHERGAG
jgi:dihydropteroate synthase